MPRNQVTDLITDQEMAFARLVLSGSMTDRSAAEAVGLNPDTAAYTKAKPRVRAYMIEHRAAVQQRLVEQETEELRRKNQWRQQVLDRLWEIAKLPAEMTRGSITGQVKAISMIVAIEGLIPDRRAGSRDNKSVPVPSQPDIYEAEWLRQQQGKTIDPQPGPPLVEEEDEAGLVEPEPAPGLPEDAPGPTYEPVESDFGNPRNYSETTPSAASASDSRVPFSIKKKNLFARRH